MNEKIINGIRSLSLDMINEAKSGHPGICLGSAAIMYTLFSNHLIFNPNDGKWSGRDRFIMSPGHGSALLYSTLFYSGYPIDIKDLKSFRQLNSKCNGHPELNTEIGVETTTGPLGQGFGNAVGIAIAEEYLSHNISKELFNYYTYCLVSDGDLMEGISYEAASLAGSLKLGKLIVLYDSNNISLDGTTKGVFDEDVLKRFESCGWHTVLVKDGEDVSSIDKAIISAKAEKNRPSIIKVNTIIGIYSKNANSSLVHGKPLEEEDLDKVKEKLGVNKIPFYVSKEAAMHFRDKISSRNDKLYNEWQDKYKDIMSKESVLQKTLKYMENDDYHINLKNIKINMDEKYNEELRSANGKIINLISKMCPTLMSGSADLFSSTKTYIDGGNDFMPDIYGRNIKFGVRESLMSSVANGLSLSNIRIITSTFLTFSDYMKPGIRLSSIMDLPVTYVFTHDSFLVGEDGPTHQPIEQLSSLRSIPNMMVFRPCDIREILGCWDYIMNNKKPVSLIISKEKYPPVDGTNIENVNKGAYIIKKEITRLSGIILSSGSEVHKALEVANILEKKALYLRVISVPSLQLFDETSSEYKKELLPDGIKVIALEASNDALWNKFVYSDKYIVDMNSFGKSGNKKDVSEYFEFDTKNLTERIEKLLK